MRKEFNKYDQDSQGQITADDLRKSLHNSLFKWGVSGSELDAALPTLKGRISLAEFRQLSLHMSEQMFFMTLKGLSKRDRQLLILAREHVSDQCSFHSACVYSVV